MQLQVFFAHDGKLIKNVSNSLTGGRKGGTERSELLGRFILRRQPVASGISGQIDLVIFMTGVGVRNLLAGIERPF